MRTFAPKEFFLRVDDKFLPRFIDLDPKLKSGASLVYIRLFSRCGNRDQCRISQKELASLCKCSVRSIQNHLRALVGLEYIQIDHGEEADVCIYTLLLSPHVRSLLHKAAIETCGADPKKLRVGGENFAYSLRDQRDQDPPLTPQISPLPKPAIPKTVNRVPVASCRDAKRSSSTRDTKGRGDSFSSFPISSPSSTSPSWRHDFNALWAIWPDKATAAWDMPCNRQLAFRAFGKLASSGQLPSIDALLATVERFKTTDSRWLGGYPPELSNWLRNRGWLKEPLVRQKKAFVEPTARTPARTPEEQRQTEVFQQRFQALEKHFQQRMAPASPVTPATSGDVDALIALWPEPERQRMPALSFARYLAGTGKAFDVGNLLPAAKEYLSTVSAPVSLLNWMRGNVLSAQVAL